MRLEHLGVAEGDGFFRLAAWGWRPVHDLALRGESVRLSEAFQPDNGFLRDTLGGRTSGCASAEKQRAREDWT
ncbi:hypothetical protein [Brevundimonas naejangsanensis]|uniref:hypothetical protein n=1 Tax=Brevundimonas naejangsanensis TaxID=588932 RepID=UPI0005566E31|nr:hypothetical protein [Brevundimonas naejangsanensis]